MCLDTLMLSIAMARLKIPGFELELFEFLCIIIHPRTLKEVPKKNLTYV